MWDRRRVGLSERVPKEELSIESLVEEIKEGKRQLAPDKRVVVIGHSFGGT